MSKSDYEKPVEAGIKEMGYRPGEPVCLLYKRNGNEYWVNGYKVFNPEERFNLTNPSKGGYRTIHLDFKSGEVPIVNANAQYFVRPTYYPPHRVCRANEVSKTYTFQEVFSA